MLANPAQSQVGTYQQTTRHWQIVLCPRRHHHRRRLSNPQCDSMAMPSVPMMPSISGSTTRKPSYSNDMCVGSVGARFLVGGYTSWGTALGWDAHGIFGRCAHSIYVGVDKADAASLPMQIKWINLICMQYHHGN